MARWLFGMITAVFPPGHRRKHRDEMMAHMEALWSRACRAGNRARVRTLAALLADTAVAAPVAWGRAVGSWISGDGTRGGTRMGGETMGSTREVRIGTWAREVSLALRRFRRRPSFTLLAVGVLAIGIGGVAAVASLAYSVLRPLDFPEPERLAAVWERHEDRRRGAAPANYLDWRRLSVGFEGLAAHRATGAAVTVDGVATRERIADVSGNFFAVLGVEPATGRGFDPALDVAFAEREIVISDGAARDRFGSPAEALGRTARVGDDAFTVVGVAAPGLAFPEPGLFGWVRAAQEAPGALGFSGDLTQLRDSWYFEVVGRLAAGATFEQARDDLVGVAARLEAQYPESNEDASVELVPLLEQTVAGFGSIVLVLGLAVALLLVAALSNVMSLAGVRAREMRPDAAVRVSLGATPSDLVRGHLTEGWLLGAIGAAVGLLLADAGLRAAAGRFASVIPRAGEVGLAPPLVAAGLLGGLAAGSVVAVAAFVGTRPHRSVRARLSPRAGGRLVLGAQVTSAIVVLSCAATVALSLQRMAAVDPGFEPDGLTTLRVALPDAASRSYQERLAEYARVAETLRAAPGVERAGVGSSGPLRTGPSAGVRFEGRAPDDIVDSGWQPVGPDFFATLGVPVVRGRGIEATDRADGAQVAVVNETFARQALGSEDPLGRRVTIGLDGHDRPLTIVGVVADTRTRGPAADPAPMMYRPITQTRRFPAESVFLAVRVRPGATVPAGEIARAAAPGMPVYEEATGHELLRAFAATQAMLLTIVGVFGLTALALGLVGVYGIGAESVRSRRREIGVRMALGATGGGILRLVVVEGSRAAAFGVAPGLLLAWTAIALLESRLFRTGLGDALVAPSVAAGVLLLAGAVLLVPARRAARTPPAESTRSA